MKTIFILTIIVVLQLEQVSALSLDDPDCIKYLDKIRSPNISKLAFTGDVSFVTGTANAKVSLRYTDNDFFNDPIYFGLVKEDGKSVDQVCLNLKLWKYTSKTQANRVQVTDLAITSSNNSEKLQRYYSFIIPQNELKTRLVETSNSNQFIYTGYYAIAYYAVGTDQLKYTFFFQFSLTIDKATGAALYTSFKPLSNPYENCTYTVCHVLFHPQIQWCNMDKFASDKTCQPEKTAPDLHLNDQFVIQSVATAYGALSNYYLTETEVLYKGDGLLKRAKPISINNTIPGQVIIQLKDEIVWNNVTIKVTSTLSTLQAGGRRMLVQTKFGQISGETQQIECIKAEGSDTCPTCEQECDANGYAQDGCPICSFSQQIAFVFFAILLVFTI